MARASSTTVELPTDIYSCTSLSISSRLPSAIAYLPVIVQSRLIMVEGKLQIEGAVIHVIVSACYNFSKLLKHLTASQKEQAASLTLSRGAENSEPGKLFGKAMNFM